MSNPHSAGTPPPLTVPAYVVTPNTYGNDVLTDERLLTLTGLHYPYLVLQPYHRPNKILLIDHTELRGCFAGQTPGCTVVELYLRDHIAYGDWRTHYVDVFTPPFTLLVSTHDVSV